MLNSVKVPKEFERIFEIAQQYVNKYFMDRMADPTRGTIEISGERYILVRAASMSVDFFETVKNLYKDRSEQEAINIARQLLFDIAHAIGKQDAKVFHQKMNLKDPIEKLSAGPLHFSHSGWAFVDIFPESKPSPDENYYLIYEHPFSFESDAWLKVGKKSDFPVCVMNAGYSSGWCEESFGVALVASEIMCKAKGDEACRFIMAHPSKIDHYINNYLDKEPEIARTITKYEIPGFFRRKQIEDELRNSEQKFKTIFNNVGGAIFLIDISTERIFDCNLQAEKLTGHARNELSVMYHNEIYPLEKYEKYRKEIFEHIIEASESIDFEAEVQCKDGRRIPVYIIAQIIKMAGKDVIMEIMVDVTERKKAEKERERFLNEITERVKELNCLYALSELSHQFELPLEELFQKIVDLIPDAWKYSDIACARIRFENNEFKTDNFRISEWKQETGIKVFGKEAGSIEVIYLEEKPKEYRGPFLREEVDLLNAIADQLGEMIERRKTRDALKSSEEYFRVLTENSSDIIMVLDKDATVTYISNSIETILGYSPEEMIGENAFQFVIPEDTPNVMRRFKELMNNPEIIHTTELHIRHKDGTEHIFEGKAKNFIEKQSIPRVIINARDITERKKSEEELRSLKQQIEFILGATKTGLDIIDSNFNIVYVDPEWQKIYGDPAGKKCYEYFAGRNSMCLTCMVPKALETKEPIVSEEVLPKERGRPIQVTSIPFQNDKGEWLVAEVNVDIVERKKREEELQDAYMRLRDAQDKLIQAEKLNAIGRLASGIAHEVRNPLGIILQGVQYLEQSLTSKNKDVIDTLSTIKHNVERANGIISSLLDFSRATNLALQREDINSVLENSLFLLKHLLESSYIQVTKEFKKDIPKILIDKNKIEQVIVNLYLNAIQAMPEGGKLIIRTYDKELERINECIDSKGEVYFSIGEKVVIVQIEDTGIGIPDEDLKRIYDPFFTTKGSGKGVGLGLAVTQSIIEMHKGIIRIQSQKNKGTQVTITLKQ